MASGTPGNPSEPRLRVWLISWCLICVGAYSLSSWAFHPLSFKPMLMTQALIVLGSGYIFFPNGNNRALKRLHILIWSLCLGLATLGIALAGHRDMALASKTALAITLLSLLMLSLTYAMSGRKIVVSLIAWNILWTMLLFTTLPLWLSPWVESITASQTQLNILLWSSPLSYLASMLDYDYLRSEWFYQHTPYGMLRYDYPDPVWFSLGLTGVSLILLAVKPVRT